MNKLTINNKIPTIYLEPLFIQISNLMSSFSFDSGHPSFAWSNDVGDIYNLRSRTDGSNPKNITITIVNTYETMYRYVSLPETCQLLISKGTLIYMLDEIVASLLKSRHIDVRKPQYRDVLHLMDFLHYLKESNVDMVELDVGLRPFNGSDSSIFVDGMMSKRYSNGGLQKVLQIVSPESYNPKEVMSGNRLQIELLTHQMNFIMLERQFV